MHRFVLLYTGLSFSTALAILPCKAQNKTVRTPDLIKLAADKKITVSNRNMTMLTDEHHINSLHLDDKEGIGLAWLDGVQFTTGTIEFDVRGKDLMQQSFAGIAFHGVNDSTYDAVYFRPFNFKSTDTIRRSHCVQYISLPQYDWPTLREKYPNKYEQAIHPSPDPNTWFHVRIVVKNMLVSVYVNNNSVPSLVVTTLNTRSDGMIGFWTGNHSAGDFANLKIINE
ncbi:MAG: hypothetical protein ABJB86_20405 [Bacteroidota bacterium]